MTLSRTRPAPLSLRPRFEASLARVASPCPEKWEAMAGGPAVRSCTACGKSVYDLSAMPRAQANRFLLVQGAGDCSRLYRRADGTVMTTDCTEGIRRKRRLTILKNVAALALSLGVGGAAVAKALAGTTASAATDEPRLEF